MLSASSRGVQEGLGPGEACQHRSAHLPPTFLNPVALTSLSLESVNTGLLVSEREPGPELGRSSVPSIDLKGEKSAPEVTQRSHHQI